MKESPEKRESDTKSIFGWIVIILAVMIASIFYPYPGKEMDIAGFIKLWLREIIFLVFFLIVFVLAGLYIFKKRKLGNNNEEQKAP